jgi:hypothetical protein
LPIRQLIETDADFILTGKGDDAVNRFSHAAETQPEVKDDFILEAKRFLGFEKKARVADALYPGIDIPPSSV